MPAAERYYKFKSGMSLAVAAAHTTLAVLGAIGRLSYSVPSRYPLLLELVGNPIWTWLHAGAAIAIITALTFRRWQVSALAAATGVMGAWSCLTLLWGLSTVSNIVSLAGPMMGGFVALLSYLLTQSWARNGGNREAVG
jgi:hypothetical protein